MFLGQGHDDLKQNYDVYGVWKFTLITERRPLPGYFFIIISKNGGNLHINN